MTFTHKLLFSVLIFAACSSGTKAATLLDTTQKKLPPVVISSPNRFNDYNTFIKDGMNALAADSVAKGIHLLNIGFNNRAANIRHSVQLMDYNFYEVLQLLAITDTAQLSLIEKNLGQNMFKKMFSGKNAMKEESFINMIENGPNTEYTKRVKTLVLNSSNKDRVEQSALELLNDNPKLVSANILMAELLFRKREYNEAINYCDKAIELWPQYAHAIHVRAQCYTRTFQFKQAIADYNTAISLCPEYGMFYYERATVLLYDKDYKAAIIDLHKTNTLLPYYKLTNYFLARCHSLLNNTDSAFYYIDKYIAANAYDASGYAAKGDFYFRQRDIPKAIEYHTRAISINDHNVYFYAGRGDDYFFSKKIDEALDDYNKALGVNNTYVYATSRIGDIYRQKNDYEQAISYYNKALALDPKYKFAYMGMYFCYSTQKKWTEAIDACHRAIAVDSTFSTSLGNLGWAYYCAGQYDQAIQFSYKALKYQDSAAYAMFNIALATLHKGDNLKARGLYQHFVDYCHEKKYTINPGAVTDLKDLIKNHIAEAEATYIIKNIFKQEL